MKMGKPTKEEKIKNLVAVYNVVVGALHIEGYSWSECIKSTNDLLLE